MKWIIGTVLLAFILIGGYFFWNGNIYSFGIKILSMYKFMKGEQVDYQDLLANKNSEPSHQLWDEMVKKYVRENGDVDYAGWVEERANLEKYLELLSSHAPSKKWSRNAQLAYWINAYNAFTIDIVLQHYPINSIKEIGGKYTFINSVWDLKFFKIGGQELDLNTIEHRILRQEFDEPRIHFAINCASYSCPKLRNEAFAAERLEQQLEEQAFYFTNNLRKNVLTPSKAELSMIFKWYQDDFEKKLPLIDYINQYASEKVDPDAEIENIDYDWSLNEVVKEI